MTVTKILGAQSGIQYQGVQDKSEADPRDALVNVLFTGEFKRGPFNQPFKVTAANIRKKLGFDPDNLQYQAVEDCLKQGVPFVWVMRVTSSKAVDDNGEPPAGVFEPIVAKAKEWTAFSLTTLSSLDIGDYSVLPAEWENTITQGTNYTVDWGDGTIENGLVEFNSKFKFLEHSYPDAATEYTITITLDKPAYKLELTEITELVKWGSMYINFYTFSSMVLAKVPNYLPSYIQDISGQFADNRVFNQNIGGWKVQNVRYMDSFLSGASVFDQDLSKWCVSKITSEPDRFSINSPLTSQHKPVWGTCPVV